MFHVCSRAREVTITGKMTVERGQATLPLDPQASLRTELVGQLAGAELALEAAIAELGLSMAGSAALDDTRAQLSALIALRQQLGHATGGALTGMRGEVIAAASGAAALAHHVTANAANDTQRHHLAAHAKEARAAIENLGSALFEQRVLDPYLQFASAEDEEAYRRRERERKEVYDKAMALGTPEGLLAANRISREQVADAKAHGADRSPDLPAIEQRMEQADRLLEPIARSSPKELARADAPSSPSAKQIDQGVDDVIAAFMATGAKTVPNPSPEPDHGLKSFAASDRTQAAQIGRA